MGSILTAELTHHNITAEISKRLRIPAVSIGGGIGGDGRELVIHDLLGINPGKTPTHCRKYRDFFKEPIGAFKKFKNDVDIGVFPCPKTNSHTIKDDAFEIFLESMEWIKPY